jgi:hypothetical protein
MVFEAVLFLAGAVLFLLAVVFFIFLWQDRIALLRRRSSLQAQIAALKEQRVDLDILERELRVWAEGLEHQQLAIAKAEEELRMLTAAKRYPDDPDGGTSSAPWVEPGATEIRQGISKNVKQRIGNPKLHEKA